MQSGKGLGGYSLCMVRAILRLTQVFSNSVLIGLGEQFTDAGGIRQAEAAAICGSGISSAGDFRAIAVTHKPVALAVEGGKEVGAMGGVGRSTDDTG